MRPSEILAIHRDDIKNIIKKYEPKGVKNLRLCGSVAIGTDTEESDIDFIIDADRRADYFVLGSLYNELSELLQCDIDMIPVDDLHPYIRKHMLQEAIML